MTPAPAPASVSTIAVDSSATPPAPAAPCTGALSLYSEMWADIYVDNKKAGRAPTREPLTLPCGSHALKLENNLGKLYFTEIKVASDKPLHLTVEKNAFQ